MTKKADDVPPVSKVVDDPTKPKSPKPGDADYDWTPHYPDGVDLYTHTYPNGTVVAIRRFKDIYSKQWMRSIKHLESSFDIEDAAINRAACETAQAVIDAVPCPVGEPDQFDLLFTAWQEADTGGLTTGGIAWLVDQVTGDLSRRDYP